MVSVIVPCYNCESTIDDTMRSLQKQKYKDFEVICVNDGSKDNTLKCLEKWKACENFNVVIVNKENGGVSSARNSGIDVAKGNYITFLDADDEYHEQYIELLVNAVEQQNADAAYCYYDRERNNVMRQQEPKTIVQNQEDAMHDLLFRMAEIAFFCYIYRQDIIQSNHIRFELNAKFGEDREFIWKYISNCNKVCQVDAPLHWYRITENSATNGKSSWSRTDTLLAVKRIEQYMEDRSISFLPLLKDYMFARHMWAVAKKFAVTHNKELFVRLRKEYDVRPCMKRTAKDNNKLVALASRLYLIHPMLFYWIVGLKK
ncbi:MAG: glycosyltransferase family 2 protein [Oscillospiraceae bacterium]|nr:glycosyltransferase family 2 protein [Oscillospiraceae bacterium]